VNCKPPHPIPYQGSKRSLAPRIARFIPGQIDTWFEPFAGSAAMTLWAAGQNVARHYVLADSCEPITRLWSDIIHHGETTAARYQAIWNGQRAGDTGYFNTIRDRYNAAKDPVDLLYLVCRCVKNAVRFNRHGLFTQSVDQRRLGMRPERMRQQILRSSRALRGRTEIRTGDWRGISSIWTRLIGAHPPAAISAMLTSWSRRD
jgi:DNA adenine methylase